MNFDSCSMKTSEEKTLGNFTIQISPQGWPRIRQTSSGESMHPSTEPFLEAMTLYIEQSRLLKRAQREKLVIWDVGLGAATNAMAAIRSLESLENAFPVQIVSFENDLNALELAYQEKEHFPHLKHDAIPALLSSRKWNCGKIQWTLHYGDILETYKNAPSPDIVYYDPFSYKSDSPLWTFSTFQVWAKAWANSRSTELFTYSASTAVRSALLASGFFVAQGIGTGQKRETTIAVRAPNLASVSAEVSACLLGTKWLEKWERSGRRYPDGIESGLIAEFDEKIRNHPQFVQALAANLSYSSHNDAR